MSGVITGLITIRFKITSTHTSMAYPCTGSIKHRAYVCVCVACLYVRTDVRNAIEINYFPPADEALEHITSIHGTVDRRLCHCHRHRRVACRRRHSTHMHTQTHTCLQCVRYCVCSSCRRLCDCHAFTRVVLENPPKTELPDTRRVASRLGRLQRLPLKSRAHTRTIMRCVR